MGKNSDTIYSSFAYIYDQIMDHVDYETWSHIITNNILKYNPKALSILDAGCGTGNLTYLLSCNFSVEGFDISEDMLFILKEKYPGISVWKGDIEKGFSTDKTYDSIVCAYDTLNYLQSQQSLKNFFDSCNKHLKSGGVLIFDMITRKKLINLFKNNFFVMEDTNLSFIWYNRFAAKNTFVNRLVFFVKQKDDLYKRYEEIHKRTLFSIKKIKETAKEYNFILEETLDGYSNKIANDDSEIIVFILKKGE
ncbi:MAG: hypothetical protein C0601_13240 [Candidatus Muiribacterium halophilum]|uniref:Methyltransferase domain-containing protein n=1 Tax=Muiribacterium halophilum TaxID=2053465 RepID=A0A2N5Z9M8_MUIH1|nr:MAG: hypothetical protein C0601_13240 [Candidatus Muirbacterium halophilum]